MYLWYFSYHSNSKLFEKSMHSEKYHHHQRQHQRQQEHHKVVSVFVFVFVYVTHSNVHIFGLRVMKTYKQENEKGSSMAKRGREREQEK